MNGKNGGAGMEITRATIQSAISEGEAHLKRMERGSERLQRYLPLSENLILEFPEDTVAILDQFIYRFTKLQDSMATRLLPSLDALLRVDTSPRPFLDILSHLEQMGAITSEEEWMYFRSLRNNLAHDYPESLKQTVTTLNALFSNWDKLRVMFETARDFYRKTVT